MATKETRADYNVNQHDTGDYFLDWLEVDGPAQKEFLRNVGEETIAASLVDIREFFTLRGSDDKNMIRLIESIGERLLKNVDQRDTQDYFLDWLDVDGPHQREFLRSVGEETIAGSLVDIRAFFALRGDDDEGMIRLTAAIGTRLLNNADHDDIKDYLLDWLKVDGLAQREFLLGIGGKSIPNSLVDIRAFFALRSGNDKNMIRLTAAIGARLLNYLVDSGKSQTDAVLELAHQRELTGLCETDCNDDR